MRSIVALLTPFHGDAVDYDKLRQLVELQVDAGTDGIVAVGTTGESPTLSHEEHRKVIETVVKAANKRVKVIAGTGSNSTHKTIEMTRFAMQVGADAALVVVPYYNKPTQEGLYQHFKAVAEVGLPIMLYNIPGRSAVNMTPATIIRLAQLPTIVSVKEASGSLDAVSEIISLRDKHGLSLDVYSGDDSLTLPIMSLGGVGVVSVVGNIVPKMLKEFVTAASSGDLVKARQLHFKLFKLTRVMFLESNPSPVKYASSLLGLTNDRVRLPLVELMPETKQAVSEALRELSLIG